MVVGKEILDSNGKALLVEDFEIKLTDEPVKVYNFQVEDFHTYHVSRLGVLVHNAEYTFHGMEQAKARGFSDSKVEEIMENYSQKGYQSEGRFYITILI